MKLRKLGIGLALTAVAGLCLYGVSRSLLSQNVHAAEGASSSPAVTGIGLTVEPMPKWFQFKSADTVNGWIEQLDNKAITEHAWELWGGLTSLTNQELNGVKVPVFETWWDRDEVLAEMNAAVPAAAGEKRKPVRRLSEPHQFQHARSKSTTTSAAGNRPVATLFDNVKYNDSIRKHVLSHNYNHGDELQKINDAWGDSKPLADRKLVDFPNDSIMLKPVVTIVSGTSPTIMPYWAGPANSTTPATPGVNTWTKKMVVIPPASGVNAAKFGIQDNGEFLPAVPVSAFYHFTITKELAESLPPGRAKAGDFGILVAMHVSSREIDNWTWQTFWWSLEKPNVPKSVKDKILAPFDHYQPAVGYSFLTDSKNPDSLTLTCYNPYLEAGFGNDVFDPPNKGQLGIESNCMSCHRAAAWPPETASYVANGIIDPADPTFFKGNTKTDFLWGIPFGVKPPPAAAPPATPAVGQARVIKAAAQVNAARLNGRKLLTNSVIPLDDEAELAAHSLILNAFTDNHKTDTMELLFSVAIPVDVRTKLEQKILKGEVVSPQELQTTYAAKAEDAAALSKWLKDEGFEITQVTPDKTSFYVRGTVAQIEKSLEVNMVRVTKEGLSYNAAQNAPSLPNAVGTNVQAIIGLQPFRKFTKKSRVHPPSALAANAAVAGSPPYLVNDVLKAYNADALDVTGAGQKIAILIDRLPVDDDLAHFWTKNNLPVNASRVEKINVKEIPLPLPDDGEESMDVQWTSGIASGATVRVYASGSLAFVDHDKSLDRIIADASGDASLRQLSISMGLGEQFLSPDGSLTGEVQVEHQKFTTLAALGVNVFVSSGDGGSNPDQFGHFGGPLQTEWMSSSPFVVAVGGTTLRLDGMGGLVSETGWAGSGGGKSKVFDRPAYQNQLATAFGRHRLVPDVSLLAAPETGAYVRVNGADRQIGGTSLSAPVWAGFCALINESRTKQGKPTLTFLNPLIYPLLGTDSFRDINDGTSNGNFKTRAGYDLVTGIGVPNLKKLIPKLSQ